MRLRWIAAVSPSALHAAVAIALGRKIVDDRIGAALNDPASSLRDYATGYDWSLSALAGHLLPLSLGIENNRELAELSISKFIGRERTSDAVARLATIIGAIEAAYLSGRPNAVDELATRGGPLREQWEARGPGLLVNLARLLPRDFLAESADVALALPVLGGGGAAHALYNSAHIEAVLANPIAELPEVCRLAWLLAQLQLDLPIFQGDQPRQQAFALGAVALAPIALAAAAEVELARFDETLLKTACRAWLCDGAPTFADTAADNVDKLMAWSDVYVSRRPSWPAAIAALAEMLGVSGRST